MQRKQGIREKIVENPPKLCRPDKRGSESLNGTPLFRFDVQLVERVRRSERAHYGENALGFSLICHPLIVFSFCHIIPSRRRYEFEV
ncbi:hypothetical protein GWI33_000309 [Rhynchophorus ferrugineus]|uniref:Uncharacterized protein n=1 Tax=Rhynchophorus ferrugineus TaxID=354439 RepID=A0A834M414_RHYFE|nr:hypothetical protein GWI33_000312 [Rhynchophorus ferrugineus]KAF7264329.1 hypothetical protein GWI33_000309 [Rhynchophorus ferrugineus]